MSLHPILDIWRSAKRLYIPQHPIDQYLQRTRRHPKPVGHEVTEIISAEYVMGYPDRHRLVLDEGFPRLVVLWHSEPLATLITPNSQESRPLVLTILTSEMYDASVKKGRYKTMDDKPLFLAEGPEKTITDLRAVIGEKEAWLRKIREAMGVDSNQHAVARAEGMRRMGAA